MRYLWTFNPFISFQLHRNDKFQRFDYVNYHLSLIILSGKWIIPFSSIVNAIKSCDQITIQNSTKAMRNILLQRTAQCHANISIIQVSFRFFFDDDQKRNVLFFSSSSSSHNIFMVVLGTIMYDVNLILKKNRRSDQIDEMIWKRCGYCSQSQLKPIYSIFHT